MVKVSHAKCRECGQTRHRTAKFNLCRQCWNRKKPQVVADWRDIKARRAAKRTPNGAVHESEAELIVAAAVDQTLEEVHHIVPRGRAPTLTPEQEAQIVNLYTTTDIPVSEIAETYGLTHTAPFRILSRNGVSWRRGDSPGRKLPPHIEAMKDVHVAPEPTPPIELPQFEMAFEEQEHIPVAAPTPAPEPEPVHPNITLARQAFEMLPDTADLNLPKWSIEFRATLTLHARSAAEAIREAESLGYSTLDVDVVRRLA